MKVEIESLEGLPSTSNKAEKFTLEGILILGNEEYNIKLEGNLYD